MAARPKMDSELLSINDKVTKMADIVGEDIERATRSVTERDGELAREILDNGDIVDDMEDEINEQCFEFLATQSPLASDLRYCISVLRMIRDLERLGDHAEDVAAFAIQLETTEEVDEDMRDINTMACLASKMVKESIRAFTERNLKLARKVWKSDDEVDGIFRRTVDRNMKLIVTDSERAQTYLILAFVALHIERMADYATNICEEIVFSMEGDYNMD